MKTKIKQKQDINNLKVKRQNGEFILSVLQMVNKPVTLNELVHHVIEHQKVSNRNLLIEMLK